MTMLKLNPAPGKYLPMPEMYGFEYDGFIGGHLCFYHPGIFGGVSLWVYPDDTWSLIVYDRRRPKGRSWKNVRDFTRSEYELVRCCTHWQVKGAGVEELCARLDEVTTGRPTGYPDKEIRRSLCEMPDDVTLKDVKIWAEENHWRWAAVRRVGNLLGLNLWEER
jgi:hypothetical protein